MGIAKAAVELLMTEGLRRPFGGRILTLGRQTCFLTWADLEACAAIKQYPLVQVPHPVVGNIDDQVLMQALGFDECYSMDNDDYEQALVLFDLNEAETPVNLVGCFDVVYDGGTSEHVFHFPNLLANVHRMTAAGGRVIHQVPTSNHVDHGFYQFSPTLLYEYYLANRYTIDNCLLIRYTQRHDTEPWGIASYTPGCLEAVSFGGLDDKMYLTFIAVTKGPESTYGVIPQQGRYVAEWQAADR